MFSVVSMRLDDGYSNNPFDDGDINYLKYLYDKYLPSQYNALVYTTNKQMTTKQVNELCSDLLDNMCQKNLLSQISDKELNGLISITQRVQKAVLEENQFFVSNTVQPKSLRANINNVKPQSFRKNIDNVAMQSQRWSFPSRIKTMPDEFKKNKAASEYENQMEFGGVHPLDAFCAEQGSAKLLNQPYLDEDNYGYREHHPVDAFCAKEHSSKYNCASQYSGYSGRTAATSQTYSRSIQFPFYS